MIYQLSFLFLNAQKPRARRDIPAGPLASTLRTKSIQAKKCRLEQKLQPARHFFTSCRGHRSWASQKAQQSTPPFFFTSGGR